MYQIVYFTRYHTADKMLCCCARASGHGLITDVKFKAHIFAKGQLNISKHCLNDTEHAN